MDSVRKMHHGLLAAALLGGMAAGGIPLEIGGRRGRMLDIDDYGIDPPYYGSKQLMKKAGKDRSAEKAKRRQAAKNRSR